MEHVVRCLVMYSVDEYNVQSVILDAVGKHMTVYAHWRNKRQRGTKDRSE
jgi:hypothetical protein